jgi:pimeloyl-ACP methyl ester carboxylesterase
MSRAARGALRPIRRGCEHADVQPRSPIAFRPAVLRPILLLLLVLASACSDGGGGAGGGDDTSIVPTAIEANGFVFESRRAGPSDGAPVILLHGFPQSSLEWEAQLAALGEAGYRAVAPDLRGYSPGARPLEVDAYQLDDLTSDVYAMADALGFERFHVVGHDWGAAIAWNVAMVDPQRIISLTAVSVPHPVAFALALANDPEQREKSQYIQFFQQAGVAEQTLLANDAALLRGIYGSGPASAHADSYVQLLSEPGALTAALNYYRALGLTGTGGSRVVVPTLYVWSTGDTALGRYGAELTADYVDGPYRFVVIEDVSHWVPEDAADEMSRLLLEHLVAFD